MVIFCPKDRGPGQLICPEVGFQFFWSWGGGREGSEKMPSTPRDFFLEEP